MDLFSETIEGAFQEKFGGRKRIMSEELLIFYMQERYYWNENVKVPDDPGDYASLKTLFDAMKVDEDRFSYYEDLINLDHDLIQLIQEFGFHITLVDESILRVDRVYNSKVTDLTGVRRGMTVQKIAGRDPMQWYMDDPEGLKEYLVASNCDVQFMDSQGTEWNLVLTRRQFIPDYIQNTQVFSLSDGRKAGYFYYSEFHSDSEFLVDDLFHQFRESAIDELVIDLRNNPGGITKISNKMLNYITGDAYIGKVYQRIEHNSRYSMLNNRQVFKPRQDRLNLPRVIFLISPYSASASEQLINNLVPFIDIVTIGGKSCGKTEGMNTLDFFQNGVPTRFFIITIKSYNHWGKTVPFDGIIPDIPVEDPILHELGDTEEPLLQKALQYLEDNPEPRAPRVRPRRSFFRSQS